ncbi:TonB-dependent receptor [Cellulophaga fucicola]|uniref:Outer membrane receptor proteins, mostly Fe transport n=2 Tax=Cellulophaga fucicola TaxID=76595 RepID=A0A1K1Q0M3_9FLAO|nr:TonB-dependent receptor [Cellulophaga fucicola]SFW53300.1 Outer membrane receptor proteins, mostly Fe transport [Cellulophaga fucicola]
MKKNYFVFVVMLLCTAFAFSQGTITGKIMDGDLGGPLPGASVVVKGTTNGMAADFDGNFSITAPSNSGVLVVSYIGYITKEISFSAIGNVGKITLMPDAEALEEVVIVASVAVDRKTPVAVSTISAADIELKLGTQEFPEVLKSTPGVYATKSGGGFGDGRINLRGFDSENVAVMINGVPVNDMENGRVYWSNWAGLSDVTSSMQVQRGLGASKVAVPSIGGTINILSKTTDVEKGGSIIGGVGNDGYQKYGATLSTGLMDNGFAATVSASKTTGEGYVDGTQFNGFNYFVNISKQINDNHKLSLTSFGAPQTHGQRQNRSSIDTYRNAESGIRFNPDWGYKNGQVTHIEDNFYHKSQTSLNHYWNIDDKSILSSAVYASWGKGGGGGTAGTNTDLFKTRLGGSDQPVDLDNIVEINRENGRQGFGSEAYLRASVNNHEWFGFLSTYKNSLTENLDLLVGIDLRDYTGDHYSEVTDLLGGNYALDNDNENNPNARLQVGDKRQYHNIGNVGWQGFFAQAEYSQDKLSAFLSTALSNTSYQRIDYFNYLDSDPDQKTDRYNFLGYSAKGGANYNIDDNHNVFANIGYFEKAANFGGVFVGFDNENQNPDAENQKIFSAEIGYGYRSEKLAANVNIYRTTWNDRTETATFNNPDGTLGTANILGVNALHQGIELDFTYRATDELTITGMASFGDWTWQNNVTDVEIFDEDQNLVNTVDIYIKDLHVGDAAQTTMALGLNYEVMPKTNLIIDYNYYDNLYANYNPSERGDASTPEAWKVPDYGLFDAGLRHGFKLGEYDTTITVRMNNVFDTRYIADAQDGGDHDALTASVFYGFGRTFSLSTKIRF